MVVGKAYLIAICDEETNAIKGAALWSSPEWEQSRIIKGSLTYVAYAVEVALQEHEPSYLGFSKAARRLLGNVNAMFGAYEKCRLHKLIPYMETIFDDWDVEPHSRMEFVPAVEMLALVEGEQQLYYQQFQKPKKPCD